MIVLFRLPIRRHNWPGLKLDPEQFGRPAARTFESRLLACGLPARLSETQVQLRRFALRPYHAKTCRRQGDQQRGDGSASRNIEPLSRGASQPSDTNLFVFK